MKMTLEEYQAADRNYEGRCLNCGEEQMSIEPDAREYTCDACGEDKVYGIQELLLMGEIEIQ